MAPSLRTHAHLALHIATSLPEFWSSDLNRATVDLVAPQPGETVVDIGAGMGPASVEAAPRVGTRGRVVAVDPSRTMRAVLRLRRRFGRLGALEIHDARAESLPLDSRSVDAVTAVNATHHVGDLGRLAEELARVLRPGGRVVLVEEDLSHEDHPFAQVAGEGQHGPPAVDVESLLELFGGVGLADPASTYRHLGGRPATVITARLP